MKTQTIKTPKAELMVVELPEWFKSFSYKKPLLEVRGNKPHIEGYTLLGNPDEISEEDAAEVVEQSIHSGLFAHYVKGIPVNAYCYNTAKESLLSLLKSEINEQFDFKRTLIFIKNEKM